MGMFDLRKVSLLLWVRLKLRWREAREDLFSLAMAPPILGALYIGFNDLGRKMYLKLQSALSVDFILVSLPYGVFFLSVVVFVISLPNFIRNLFAYETNESYLRALPLRPSDRAVSVLIAGAVRNLVPGGLVGYLAYRIHADFLQLHDGPMLFITVAVLFALIFTPLEILYVLVLAKARCLTGRRFLIMIGLWISVAYLLHRNHWDRFNLFLYPFFPITRLMSLPSARTAFYLLLSGALVGLFASVAVVIFNAWSESLSDVVITSQRRERVVLRSFFKLVLDRISNHKVAALVKRDLVLTLRVFHRGILINLAAVFFFMVLLVYFTARYDIRTGPYLLVLSTGLCALGVLSISLIAVRLLRYQLEFIWIDKSLAIDAHDLWFGKVLFANLLSLLSVPTLTAVALAIFPRPLLSEVAYVFAISVVMTVVVASFTGSLVYEFERHPVLALFFCFMASVPLIIIMVATYWWLIFFIFPYAMHHLKDRGLSRVRIIMKYGRR